MASLDRWAAPRPELAAPDDPTRSLCGVSCATCPLYQVACAGCPGCAIALVHDHSRGECASKPGSLEIYACPRNPQTWVALRQYQGYAFPPVTPTAWPAGWIRSVYLPATTNRLDRVYSPSELPWVSIHAANALMKHAPHLRASVRGRANLQRTYRLDPGTLTFLHFYVRDDVLNQRLWDHRQELYPELRDTFDVVFGPNFSLYEDAPRIEHILNMKRSTIVYQEMLEAGIRVIPDISWDQEEDLRRWAEWIRAYRVTTFAMSVQRVGHENHANRAWRGYYLGIQYLLRMLDDVGPITLFLIGTSARKHLVQLAEDLPPYARVVVSNTQIATLAARRLEGLDRVPVQNVTYGDGFVKNFGLYEAAYQVALGPYAPVAELGWATF